MRKRNPALVTNARQLRKNMTAEEKMLWYQFLRRYPLRFARQKILGVYIADFYCAKANLVIELDGAQHYTKRCMLQDAVRTEFLKGYGLTVLRIPNNAVVENFEGVCEYIDAIVKTQVKGHPAGW